MTSFSLRFVPSLRRRKWLAAVVCLAGAPLAGCTGSVVDSARVLGGPGGEAQAGGNGEGAHGGNSNGGAGGATSTGASSLDAPTSFVCDSSQKPPTDELRALSTDQYKNTMSDLISWLMNDAAAGPKVMTEIAAALASLPGNAPIVPHDAAGLNITFPDGGWLRADQDIQFSRVSAFYNIGAAAAQALVSSSRLATVVGACATDGNAGNDATCLSSFLQKVAPRILRRPITSADTAFYSDIYGTNTAADPAAYADVLTALFNASEMLYFVEHGDAVVSAGSGIYKLSPYELAARLSYHVWDTMPDNELWQTAVDGTLLQDAVYQKQVDRMFADARAQKAMHRFFLDYIQANDSGGPRGTGGLNYHNLALRVAEPEFKAFAGSDLPTGSLEQNMIADAVGMLDYYTWTTPGSVHDLLTSGLSFAKTADVAKIYGVSTWDGKSAPPAFASGQRPGLFTRAFFVAAGGDTSPILKGVYLRRYALCDTIGLPPPAAANAKVDLSTTQTTRQVTTALTSGPACSGCHTNYINPLGFATENFDGLGRIRTQQTLFNSDGTVATKLPVDTAVVPHVEFEDGTSKAAGPADVMNLIDASNKPAACLARNYFRYTFARFEDLSLDACSLEAMRSKLDQGGHLVDMLKAVTQTPAFKQRTFQ